VGANRMTSSPSATQGGRLLPPLWFLFALPAALWTLFGCAASPPTTAEREAAEESAGPSWFEDWTDHARIDFVHDPGPTGPCFMPQSMGSGGAFFDFDGDGLLDVYLLQGAGSDSRSVNRLYRHLPDHTFQDVTAGSGLDVAGFNTGVAIGDVNNDGLPDVLLTQYGGIKLFLNRGGGRFEDITAASELINPLWAMSAAFVDYDRDGWLDLVVVNYVDYDPKRGCTAPDGRPDFCGPNQFPGTCSKLFRNCGRAAPLTPDPSAPKWGRGEEEGKPLAPLRGEKGRDDGVVRFEDVSFASGIGRVPGPGLGVVCADFNGDGWPDIFIANDGQPNRLWINGHDGTFRDEAVSRNVACTAMGRSYAGMGVALGDVNNDGLLDLYVTHLNIETNTLWRQHRPGEFLDATQQTGLLATRWRGTGFGTLMADFNNDGALDLAVVNGRVFRGGPARDPGLGFWETYAERNQLFANDGSGAFRDLSPANPALCGHWNVGRGLAQGDFDNDGGQDLLVCSIGGRVRLLRNAAPQRGHWLKVRAVDPRLHRDAYGAEVRIRAGGRQHVRLVNPGESYLSSSSPLVHFGLGVANQVDSLQVTWPDGLCEKFPVGGVDRTVELRRGEGCKP
jgi:hypothetical protein